MPSLTSKPKSDRDALNAYVDGELHPAEAAEIAARISREPGLARQAATLAQIKAATAAAFDTAGFVPDLSAAAPERSAPRRIRAFATAAMLALLITAGVAGHGLFSRNEPAWLSAAAAQHLMLSAQPASGRPALATVAALAGFQPYMPDLTAARLRPVAAVPFRADAAHGGLAVHYRGTRGCKLSYIAFTLAGDDSPLGEKLAEIASGGTHGYGWRVGDIGYLLIAAGMDPARLATLAETVHVASRKHRPLDEAARQLLAQSRAASRSCAA